MSSSIADPKIIDLLNDRKKAANGSGGNGGAVASLEYFPPRTDEGVKNLYARMTRMKNNVSPLFTDVTWGAGGSTADLSMQIALEAHKRGHVANLHMTCTNLAGDTDPKVAVKDALQQALDGGIRNIVALRGDPPAGEEEWKVAEGGFSCALDLVKFIRAEFSDNVFGISVAGYPEGHPNAITEITDPSTMTPSEAARSSKSHETGQVYTCKDEDYEKEMIYLKEKIDAGADFIITQMFFDAQVFIQFVKDCREKYDIQCPVIPGLMCLNNYGGFRKMTKFCKTRVPADLDEGIEAVDKDDKDAMKVYGTEFGRKMCNDLMEFLNEDVAPYALHFYTLNLEKVVYGILTELKMMTNVEDANEADANLMTAVGSAWARVGDTVQTKDDKKQKGVVTDLHKDGTAVIKLSSEDGNGEEITLKKGEYEKVF